MPDAAGGRRAPAGAVRRAVDQFVDLFTAMGGLMAERATDLRDIERRLVARLVGEPEPGVAEPEVPSVLLAEDLAPADTAGLDPAVVLGPGHRARRAHQPHRDHRPPARHPLHGRLSPARCDLAAGTPVLVDGTARHRRARPGRREAAARVAADRAERARGSRRWAGPARTADGSRVKLLANVADGASARTAADAPVEGVGLFRTELCFLDRRDEPSVEEQADHLYRGPRAFAGPEQHVVVRTLDAGSDKPIAFATLGGEDNPALGVRGLRLSAATPALLDRQLDAIAEAAGAHRRRGVGDGADGGDGGRGADFAGPGACPRADCPGSWSRCPARRCWRADARGRRLPLDRHQRPDPVHDGRRPDGLRPGRPHRPVAARGAAGGGLTAAAGQAAGKPVGVCGEAAADPLLAVALAGMGVTSLSMAPAAVRPVGAQLSVVGMDTCRRAADAALAAADPRAGREAVRRLVL